jgi:hypothetical protein
MNDMLAKACARLMKRAGFEHTATLLEAGNLTAVRAMLPAIDPCAKLARRTAHAKRNQRERDTIAAVDALHNLLDARAA